MINSSTKYNPDYHSNIPRNIRAYWDGALLSDQRTPKPNYPLDPAVWTDERLFNLWRDLGYEVADDENLLDLIGDRIAQEEMTEQEGPDRGRS